MNLNEALSSYIAYSIGICAILWALYAEYRIYKIEQAAVDVGVRLLKDRNTALGKLEQYEDIEKK